MAKRMRTAKTPSDGGDRDVALHDLAISPLLQEVATNDSADATAGDEKTTRAAATRSRGAAAGSNNTTASAAARAGEASSAAKGKSTSTTANGSADNKHVMLPAFLSKTFEIFSMQEFSNICGWNASGDTIIVSQLEAFVAMVLPRFFKHRNFPSFVRQLNLYGFHKTVLDSKRLEFQHPYFKRDRPDLLHYIKRKVSSGSSSTQQQQQQQIVNSSIQNSRLEAHREISDNLLREMKELRQRSEAMEKRLRELEIDNAIVRSDNIKLWKHLETAKDKQLIMQEKLKKIMWILFQIYRGKQGIPKLSSNDSTSVITEDYINSSLLGPKEFREVLRYLAMDEPPLLPRSSTDVEVPSQGPRKRKFVEVPSDDTDQFASSLYKIEPSSVVEVSSPITTTNSSAMTVASNPPSTTPTLDSTNNVLSLFSPSSTGPRTEFANSDLNALIANAMSSTLANYGTNSAESSARENNTNLDANGESGTAAASHLDFIDDELPLLSDSETYNFGEGEEQQVMKKLEDFETSLLDEYDVGCLDTLLQQLKNSSVGKPSPGVAVIDPEEIFVGDHEEGSPRNA